MKRYWMLTIGFPIVAAAAGWGGWERVQADRALRILALPPAAQATIVSKAWIVPSGRRAGSPYHQITLRLPGRQFSVRVMPSDYETATEGGTTGWHVDPATGEGIADVERMKRITGMYFPYALAVVLTLILCSGMWLGLPGGGGEARVRRGAPPGREPAKPLLPPPPRKEHRRWEEWLEKKYPPLRFLLAIPAVGAAPFVAGFLIAGWTEPAVILIVHAAMAGFVVLRSRAGGRSRDRRFWRDGLEIPVTSLDARTSGNVWLITASFVNGGEPYTLTQRWPIECGTPADSVLVDPKRWRRATVTPPV